LAKQSSRGYSVALQNAGELESRTNKSEIMKTACTIRAATESDLEAINDIYNHYVLHSTCTYQEEPEPLESRKRWFSHHGDSHPVIVAAIDAKVIGWGSLSAYHTRSAYRHTVENSVYVHHQHHRQGIGSLLLEELILRSRGLGHRVIIAGIDGEQTASVALHAKFNFEKAGHLRQVGFKFGRWLDVIYMELNLSGS
jgi:phosphinothricin acetyltransferase